MDIDNPKYLEDTFIVRKANYDGYDSHEFSELVDVKVLSSETINEYFGEWEIQNELIGSIIYKCTPVFIIRSETVLKEIT